MLYGDEETESANSSDPPIVWENERFAGLKRVDERRVGRLRKRGCDAEEPEDEREDVDSKKHFEKRDVVGMSR